MRSGQTVADATISLRVNDERLVTWPFGQLPRRSQPVYPAQIISSITAACDLSLSVGLLPIPPT